MATHETHMYAILRSKRYFKLKRPIYIDVYSRGGTNLLAIITKNHIVFRSGLNDSASFMHQRMELKSNNSYFNSKREAVAYIFKELKPIKKEISLDRVRYLLKEDGFIGRQVDKRFL